MEISRLQELSGIYTAESFRCNLYIFFNRVYGSSERQQ